MCHDIDTSSGGQLSERRSEKRPPELQDEYQFVIRWIPLVLPLLALLILSVVYFIDWAVLAYTV